MSATLLQLVNRARRRLKFEDVADVAERRSVVLIDLLGEAQREILESDEWDFDIRTNGVLTTIRPYEYTALGSNVAANELNVVGGTDHAVFAVGTSRSRIAFPLDPSFGQTYLNILTTRNTSGTTDRYIIETTWPGGNYSGASKTDVKILTTEYVLPATVRDVLSVSVEEKDVALQFADKDADFDRMIPNAFTQTSATPEVCVVGGSTLPTVAYSVAQVPALGLWIYPVPSEAYVVRYTYRYRHPVLSAASDVLYVPDHIIDDIVELAVARAYRSRIANDSQLAMQSEIATQARLKRKHAMTDPQPTQRRSLQSHDRRGVRMPIGSQPRNPREFV